MTGYRYRLYDSLATFYREADPRLREFSRETDFGVHWTDPPLPGQIPSALPRWRVAWVRETGEVYAVAQSGRDRKVRLYGAMPGEAAVEEFLAGWTDHCGPGGLAWLEGLFAARGIGPNNEPPIGYAAGDDYLFGPPPGGTTGGDRDGTTD